MTNTRNKTHCLDITGEICPMTFVRTKLKLEKMNSGEILELRLKGDEPLRNIPRSLSELGHSVTELSEESHGIWVMRISRA